jgi:hypothetical protein
MHGTFHTPVQPCFSLAQDYLFGVFRFELLVLWLHEKSPPSEASRRATKCGLLALLWARLKVPLRMLLLAGDYFIL